MDDVKIVVFDLIDFRSRNRSYNHFIKFHFILSIVTLLACAVALKGKGKVGEEKDGGTARERQGKRHLPRHPSPPLPPSLFTPITSLLTPLRRLSPCLLTDSAENVI